MAEILSFEDWLKEKYNLKLTDDQHPWVVKKWYERYQEYLNREEIERG